MIKYDIQHLSNTQGKGISRPYVQLSIQRHPPSAELEEDGRAQYHAEACLHVKSQLATENILRPRNNPENKQVLWALCIDTKGSIGFGP